MKVLFLRRINPEKPAELFASALKANSSGRSQKQGEPERHEDLGLPTQEVRVKMQMLDQTTFQVNVFTCV